MCMWTIAERLLVLVSAQRQYNAFRAQEIIA